MTYYEVVVSHIYFVCKLEFTSYNQRRIIKLFIIANNLS
jgi:hypothetical protein